MSTPWLNGLPWKPYGYRGDGTDTLTAFIDDEPVPPRPGGRPRMQPCGTEAGYKWHLRHGEKPVRAYCHACADANARAYIDRNGGSGSEVNTSRRERYRQALDAGHSPAEAKAMRQRRTA